MIALDVSAAYAIANGTDGGRRMQALMVEDEKVVAPTLFSPRPQMRRGSLPASGEQTALSPSRR